MNKIVLITGVAGGIGYATAQHFKQNGWVVVGVDRQDTSSLPDIDCRIQVDIAEPQAIQKVVLQLRQEFDNLHCLVNNAAVQICKPSLEMTVAEWDEIMAVNVRSCFFLAQATYPLLKPVAGSVVNVSSVHAVATSANIAAYATSKGALLAMTRALAIEFASANIRVNAILPGAVDTSMLRSGLQRGHLSGDYVDELLTDLGKKTVIGRVGNPREIAEAIWFLANNTCSSFMTGQSLIVDGGATARLSTE
ncbi:SDR family NAD(P)-dependent oxidoreductase [Thermocoleostomius sinensis]|uniref:SDR family NAD(P)-dependent oxidoreductase n=1 Tax=Thermocoleostomius sinensis A174 TaxID=2016057 RepID=A0A9E8Z9F7_9CYAN|nr:SDR family oxidoreductase [Thermocoleostomius sinensis]WAL58975.1 SDR family NAD(P)-dependent oxidoreductase [Thermocoleostomius sinensis A174]